MQFTVSLEFYIDLEPGKYKILKLAQLISLESDQKQGRE